MEQTERRTKIYFQLCQGAAHFRTECKITKNILILQHKKSTVNKNIKLIYFLELVLINHSVELHLIINNKVNL